MNYLFIGTTTADMVNNGRILGGTVSYGAPIARLFGHNVRILTSSPADDDLLLPLRDIAHLQIIPSAHLTTFDNIYTDGIRQQKIHHVANKITIDDLPEHWASSELVHLAPLADDVDFNFVHQFDNATILLTPQGYMRQWGKDGIVRFKHFLDRHMLSTVDILVLSQQDIADAPELEQEYPHYVEHVIITNGDQAGVYYHNGEKIIFETYPTEEVDPTGAGDVFATSVLASLPFVQNNMRVAIDVASRIAARSVSVQGIDLTLPPSDIKDIIYKAQQKYD